MTDDQFERIKKGLNFHSEGGVYNLCTLTETALRTIIEDAVKFYEKQQKIDAEQIRALQKDKGELTDKVKELKAQNEEIENYFVESAGYARDKVRNFMDIVNKALKQKGERIAELEAQIEKMKNCRNCKNEKIEGACGHFTQVGWCKNWELAN